MVHGCIAPPLIIWIGSMVYSRFKSQPTKAIVPPILRLIPLTGKHWTLNCSWVVLVVKYGHHGCLWMAMGTLVPVCSSIL